MKKLLSILVLCLLMISLRAQRYDIISQDVCWNTGSVDSSLTRYFLVSTRASNVKLLTYLNATGQSVDVSGGGSFAQGHCGCCGDSSTSLPAAGSPARSGLTNDNDTLKLGGVVEENTSIGGMNEYGLDVTNWKYLNFSASDSFKIITPGLISASVKEGGLLQVNSLTGRVEFTPYAFPLTTGIDGQFQQLNGTTGELEWRSPYITAEETDSSYRFSINGSSISEVPFPNIYIGVQQGASTDFVIVDSIGFVPVFSRDDQWHRAFASRGQFPTAMITKIIDDSTFQYIKQGRIKVVHHAFDINKTYYLTYEGLASTKADSIYPVPLVWVDSDSTIVFQLSSQIISPQKDNRDSLSYGLGEDLVVNKDFSTWSIGSADVAASITGDSVIFTDAIAFSYSGAPYIGVSGMALGQDYQACITILDHPSNPNVGALSPQVGNFNGGNSGTVGIYCDTINYASGVARYWLETANSATNLVGTDPTMRLIVEAPTFTIDTQVEETQQLTTISPDDNTLEYINKEFAVKDVPLSKISQLGWIYVDGTLNEVLDTITTSHSLYINREVFLSGNEVVPKTVQLIFGPKGLINHEEYTVDIQGSIQATNRKIFEGDASLVGKLTFTLNMPNAEGKVYAAWWGSGQIYSGDANGDAITKAMKSIGGRNPSGTLILEPGIYYCRSILYPGSGFDVRYMNIKGGGERPTNIRLMPGETNPWFAPNVVFEVEYSNFLIDATEADPSLQYVLGTTGGGNSYDIRWTNIQVRNHPIWGMYIRGGQKHHLDNVYVKQNGGGGYRAGTTGLVIEEAFGVWVEQFDGEYNQVGIRIQLDTAQAIHRIKGLNTTIVNSYNEGNEYNILIQDAGGIEVINNYDGKVRIEATEQISVGNKISGAEVVSIGQGAYGTIIDKRDNLAIDVQFDSLTLDEAASTIVNGNLIGEYDPALHTSQLDSSFLFPPRTFGAFVGSFDVDSLSGSFFGDCLFEKSGVAYPVAESGNGASQPSVTLSGISWDSIASGDTVYIYLLINVLSNPKGGYIYPQPQTSTEFFDFATNTWSSSANEARKPAVFVKNGINKLKIPVYFDEDGPSGSGLLRINGSDNSGELSYAVEYVAITKQDNLGYYLSNGVSIYDYECEQTVSVTNPQGGNNTIQAALDSLDQHIDDLEATLLPTVQGTSTTTAGPGTSLIITHNLGQAPTYISITPGGDIGDWYVNTINSTTMTLNYTSTATTTASSVNIYWQVE